MVYGNKLVYAYDDEELGKDGEIKKVIKKLELTFSPITLIKYQNYTGREFMVDFMSINLNMTNKIRPELKQKIEKGEELTYGDITEEDIRALSSSDMNKNTEFFINITASLIATTAYPKILDFAEIINSLPVFLFNDENFLNELIQLMSFNLKKNNQLVAQQIARIKLH